MPEAVDCSLGTNLEPARRRHPRPQALPHDPRRRNPRLARRCKTALEKIQYDRFLTVELYTQTADPQTAAIKSHQFLARMFRRLSGVLNGLPRL